MSFTNKTSNYDLPQYIATDKPTYLVDANGAYLAIDTAMKANETAAATAQSTADGNTSAINTLNGQINNEGGIADRVGDVETLASTTAGSVNTITSLIGNGEPTTTDKTLIGAINEINENVTTFEAKFDDYAVVGGKSKVEVVADGVKTLSALIDELAASLLAYCASLSNKEYIEIKSFGVTSGYGPSFSVDSIILNHDSAAISLRATQTVVAASYAEFRQANIIGSGSSLYAYNGTTTTDKSSDVPANGVKVNIEFMEYKNI